MLPEIAPAMAIDVCGRCCGSMASRRITSGFTESCGITSCCFIAVATSRCRIVGMMAGLLSMPAINVGVPMDSSSAAITASESGLRLHWTAVTGRR